MSSPRRARKPRPDVCKKRLRPFPGIQEALMKQSVVFCALLAFVLAFPMAAQAAKGDKGTRAEKAQSSSLSRQDKKFIDKAMHDNNAEVAIAKVALEKAQGAEVKQFAQRLLNDHQKAGSELEGIVSRLGYSPSKKAMDKEPKE